MNDWMTVWINYNEVERIIIIKFCLSLKHICTKVFLLISLRFLAEVTSDRDVAASAAEADSEEDNAFGADAAGWWVDRGGAVREESGGGSSTMTDLSTSYLDLLQTPPSSSLCRCHRTTILRRRLPFTTDSFPVSAACCLCVRPTPSVRKGSHVISEKNHLFRLRPRRPLQSDALQTDSTRSTQNVFIVAKRPDHREKIMKGG